jgi:hypothetical protein
VLKNGAFTETDWTSDTTSGTTALTVTFTGFTVSWADANMTTSVVYRCVTDAHNNLGNIPTAPAAPPSGSFRVK